jgi:hypothetical protein
MLPDGIVLSGLLMEYIEGWNLDSSFTRELTPDRQIKMVRVSQHSLLVHKLLDSAGESNFKF